MVNIDFTIWDKTLDTKRIYIADISDWGIIEGYDSWIDITAPGSNTPVTFPFDKGGLTVVTAITLGIQGSISPNLLRDIPDGIYTIKVYGTPSTYFKEKSFLKYDSFWIKFQTVMLSAMDNCGNISDHDRNMLIKIWFLMQAAAAQVRLGNTCKAEELYREADKLLKNLDCNGLLCRQG